jgi:hypothetical protein
MSLGTKIKLGNTIIPSIPFIWYREQEMVCPIDYVGYLSVEQVKDLYDCEIYTAPYVVVQRHINASATLYLCLHSLLYYTLFPTQGELLIIPRNFCRDVHFSVKLIPLNNTKIFQVRGGLITDSFVDGSVFIHDAAFSPPGCLHFKVDDSTEKSEFICIIKCPDIGVNMACLFILFNDLDGSNIDTLKKLKFE